MADGEGGKWVERVGRADGSGRGKIGGRRGHWLVGDRALAGDSVASNVELGALLQRARRVEELDEGCGGRKGEHDRIVVEDDISYDSRVVCVPEREWRVGDADDFVADHVKVKSGVK